MEADFLAKSGLVSAEAQQVQWYLAHVVSGTQAFSVGAWFRMQDETLTREKAIASFAATFPGWGEKELLEIAEARWLDGFTGHVCAVILGRESE